MVEYLGSESWKTFVVVSSDERNNLKGGNTPTDDTKECDKKESESICVLTPPDVEYFLESMSDTDKHLLALDWKPKIYRANTIYGIPCQGFIWIDNDCIECLYVSPKYRNKGLASRLMIHALSRMMGFLEIRVKSKKGNKTIEGLLKKFDFICTEKRDGIKEWVMKYERKVMPTTLEWMNNDQRSFRNFMIEGSRVVIIGEAHVKHKTDIIDWNALAQQEISVVLAEDQLAYPDSSLIPYFDKGKHRNLPNMKYVAYDRRVLMNKNEDMKPYRRWFIELDYSKIPDKWNRGKYPYDNISEFKENLKKISRLDCLSTHDLFLLPEDRITDIQPKTHAFFRSLSCNYDTVGSLDTCLADIPMCSCLEKYINEKMPVIVVYCGDQHTLFLEKFIIDNYKPWMIKTEDIIPAHANIIQLKDFDSKKKYDYPLFVICEEGAAYDFDLHKFICVVELSDSITNPEIIYGKKAYQVFRLPRGHEREFIKSRFETAQPHFESQETYTDIEQKMIQHEIYTTGFKAVNLLQIALNNYCLRHSKVISSKDVKFIGQGAYNVVVQVDGHLLLRISVGNPEMFSRKSYEDIMNSEGYIGIVKPVEVEDGYTVIPKLYPIDEKNVNHDAYIRCLDALEKFFKEHMEYAYFDLHAENIMQNKDGTEYYLSDIDLTMITDSYIESLKKHKVDVSKWLKWKELDEIYDFVAFASDVLIESGRSEDITRTSLTCILIEYCKIHSIFERRIPISEDTVKMILDKANIHSKK